jgi:hypothetical protein
LVIVSKRITMLAETHALLSSASMGEVARVQQLLDSGVPLNAASPGGFTALYAACMTGQQQVLELLLQYHQQPGSLEPYLPHCVAAAASAAM